MASVALNYYVFHLHWSAAKGPNVFLSSNQVSTLK